jgi:hypothetical protein
VGNREHPGIDIIVAEADRDGIDVAISGGMAGCESDEEESAGGSRIGLCAPPRSTDRHLNRTNFTTEPPHSIDPYL